MIVDLQEENSLVEVSNNQTVVSSSRIAKHFGKEHYHVMRDIDKLVKDLSVSKIGDTPKMFLKSTYIHAQNKQEYPMYLMNRDGFSLLVMGFTGKEALAWKIKYINAFNKMEEKLKLIQQQEIGRLIERERGKEARRGLTDAIKENIPETPFKKFAYKNFTNLAYIKAFGKDTRALKVERNLKKKDNLRDFLTQEELSLVKKSEDFVKGCIGIGYDYEEVKSIIEGRTLTSL